jgi:hypothetical protein
MPVVLHEFGSLVQDSLLGLMLALAMGAAVAQGVALLVAILRKKRERAFLLGTWVALGVGVVLAGLVVWAGYDTMRNLVLAQLSAGVDPSQKARMLAEAVSRIDSTQYFVTRVSIPLLILTAVSLWRARPLGSSKRLTLLAIVLAVVTLVVIAIRAERAQHGYGGGCETVACRDVSFSDMLAEGVSVVRSGTYVLCTGGLLAVVMLAWLGVRDARRGILASRRALFTSTGLLAVGVAANLGASATAFDAAHPLPPVLDGGECFVDEEESERLPSGPPHCTWTDRPMIRIEGSQTTLNGEVMADPRGLEESLVKKRELWAAVSPGQKDGLHTVLVVAPRNTTGFRPWLEGAGRAGFDRIAVVYRVDPTVVTRTRSLGPLPRVRCCEAIWNTSSNPDSLSRFATWEEFAAAAIGK